MESTFMVYSYMLDGDTFWLTQQRNQNGPFANPFTSKRIPAERTSRLDISNE